MDSVDKRIVYGASAAGALALGYLLWSYSRPANDEWKGGPPKAKAVATVPVKEGVQVTWFTDPINLKDHGLMYKVTGGDLEMILS